MLPSMSKGRAWWSVLLVVLVACAGNAAPDDPGSVGDPAGGTIPGGGPGSGSDPAPPATTEIVLDGLQPGWLVSTTRLVDDLSPAEATQVSDGSPIMLQGTDRDVFLATVTDGDGNLVVLHAMGAPCTMAASKQLRVPADFPTIQAAIDAAAPGDTVKVAPGTYTESVSLRAGVCLLGSGARRTILDAGGETRTLIDLTHAPGSVVAGFTLRGVRSISGCANSDPFACSGEWYRAAIYLGGESWTNPTQDAPPLVTDNIFEDNEIAVMLYWHGVSVIRNNVFVDNDSAFVANHYQDRTLVASNVFFDNAQLAIGNQAAYLDILDNIIVGSATGIRFEYVQTGHIACNVFYANGENENDDRFAIGTDGNIEADPHFVDAPAHDFHLDPSSPAIDHGCGQGAAFEPDGTPIDIGAYGGPLARWVDL